MHETAPQSDRPERPDVLLLDDDPQIRRGMARVLGQRGFGSVRTARCCEDARVMLEASLPGVLMVDIHLGEDEPDGIEFLAQARSAGFSGPAVVLSGDATIEQFFRAAQAGATDYIVKMGMNPATELERILARPRKTPDLKWRVDALKELSYCRAWELTDWQVAVLSEFVVGYPSNKEIAERLGRSEVWIRQTFTDVYRRAGTHSRTELAHLLTVCSMCG